MLEALLTYLNNQIKAVHPDWEVLGLADAIPKGEITVPAVLCNGEHQAINLDAAKGTSWWVRRREDAIETIDGSRFAKAEDFERRTYYLRLYAYAQKGYQERTGSTGADALARNLMPSLRLNSPRTLRVQLSISGIEGKTGAVYTDAQALYAEQFKGATAKNLDYTSPFFSLDYTLQIEGPVSCFAASCDISIPDAGEATVQNSDGTYSQSVEAGDTLNLPDITVTAPDGTLLTFPSAKNISVGEEYCPECPEPDCDDIFELWAGLNNAGRDAFLQSINATDLNRGLTVTQRNRLNKLLPIAPGGSVSFATGDAADLASANAQLTDFHTLKEANDFGNLLRFTNAAGAAVASADLYIIDHKTGMGMRKSGTSSGFGTANWATAISNCNGSTLDGRDDWFLPSRTAIDLVIANTNDAFIGLSWWGIVQDLWTSTTRGTTTTAFFFNGLAIQSTAKTNSMHYLMFRRHYT